MVYLLNRLLINAVVMLCVHIDLTAYKICFINSRKPYNHNKMSLTLTSKHVNLSIKLFKSNILSDQKKCPYI